MMKFKSHIFALFFLVLSITISCIHSTPVGLSTRCVKDLSNVRGILITSPVSGHNYEFGDEIEIIIHPDPSVKVIYELNLQIAAERTVYVFERNITLTPPGQEYYVLKYNLPKKGEYNLTDDARYHIGIFDSEGEFIAASGTFNIGCPKFGLTMLSPPVNQTYHPGDEICVTWSDKFDLYQDIKAIIHLFYYNEKNEISEPPLDVFVDYELSKGEATIKVPDFPNHRNYVIIIGFNRTSDIDGTVDGKPQVVLEHYIANTFNIVSGCTDAY
ncbi:8450_t:CDS:2 [Acaulospora morrowiae]|uniref:8450_t:CDS:1 n=1 Tax=Acaulospora morrowiae TaxID=94023 RepID=A0A9N8Z3A9_9GLOM|nr:8450_t:CDS:2 [Acaulospora morrowiae]